MQRNFHGISVSSAQGCSDCAEIKVMDWPHPVGRDAKPAWYVYQERSTIYQFETPGNYTVKVFIVQNGRKKSFLGSPFTVSL